MTKYVLAMDLHAMDHIPEEDMLTVGRAAHAVCQEAIDAGILVCTGGLEEQRSRTVAPDGTVTDGPQVSVGGLTVIEVPSREEAYRWAARVAAACRASQDVWEIGPDPELDTMLAEAAARRSYPGA